MYISKDHKILLFLILFRFISVFLVQTAHVPDEYWQSLEVAHRLAFGYGYLTWEWTAKIRNCFYPFLISVIYRMLSLLSLDYVSILTTLPRVIQAIISAYGEYRFYVWTRNKWTLYSLCINWYWYYCATRTIINTLETSCTMIALSVFPWRDSNIKSLKFLWIVGLLCMMRPTAAVIWIPLCLYQFSTSLQNELVLVCKYGVIGGVCIMISILLDSLYYGTLVMSHWQFFRANVLYQVGDLYGKEHLLWYFFSALPVLLGLHYILLLLGIWQIFKHPAQYHRQAILLTVIGWTIGVYSLLSHKEFRFLLPLLPMLLYISTSCVFHLNIRFSRMRRKVCIALFIISNVLPGLYFCLIHQRGSLDVMEVLHEELSNSNVNTTNVLFLTPCHATPLYSHLHINVSTRILTCEPNFTSSMEQRSIYVNEVDTFFQNPMQWLDYNYIKNPNVALPSHIVLYENLLPRISKFMENYQIVVRLFYSHFPESNYDNYIYVYKLIKSL